MHLAKFKLGEIVGVAKHNSRAKCQKHSNEKIVPEQSHLNYNLAEHQMLRDTDFIKQQLASIKNTGRSTLNVACNWVVQLPAAIPDQEEAFFQRVYDFLEDRYGKDNVVSAHVHLDETTPHMHFSFTPVKYDEKLGCLKFDAKNVINRVELKKCQTDLDKIILSEFELTAGQGIMNGATAKGNKTIAEMKTQALEIKNKNLENKIENLEEVIEEKNFQIKTLEQSVHEITNEAKKATESLSKKQKEIEGLELQVNGLIALRDGIMAKLRQIYQVVDMAMKSIRENKVLKYFMNRSGTTLNELIEETKNMPLEASTEEELIVEDTRNFIVEKIKEFDLQEEFEKDSEFFQEKESDI